MFEINRSAITIFGAGIHWYGVLIALGVLGAVLLAMVRERKLGLKKDTSLNLALILVPTGVICARIYYVIFSWDFYRANPAEIFNLRGGGLAVYGAVIGGAIAAFIYARIARISFASIADLIAPGLALGQAIGRWGNFLNQEAYGAPVANPALQFFPMAVYIEGSGWRWATFFYESIWCALVCALLLTGERKRFFKKKGDMFLAYAFLYALERSIVEGLRTDSLLLGSFRVSQLLSCFVLAALVILLCIRMRGRRLTRRRIELCLFALVFVVNVLACNALVSMVWGLVVLLDARQGYKSIPRTNDEM